MLWVVSLIAGWPTYTIPSCRSPGNEKSLQLNLRQCLWITNLISFPVQPCLSLGAPDGRCALSPLTRTSKRPPPPDPGLTSLHLFVPFRRHVTLTIRPVAGLAKACASTAEHLESLKVSALIIATGLFNLMFY